MKSSLLNASGWRLRSSSGIFCWITYIVSGFFHRHLLSFAHYITPYLAPLALMYIPLLYLGCINALVRHTRQASLCLYPAKTTKVCRFGTGVSLTDYAQKKPLKGEGAWAGLTKRVRNHVTPERVRPLVPEFPFLAPIYRRFTVLHFLLLRFHNIYVFTSKSLPSRS